eukprot:TRINITY_DN33058_c0_g1_i1.p1 TRINITY_DN33058_c0_g1~~TRINITY_DN33058_c0_g1_i1.p1  ORF type:complete len:485 (-),score=109.57 TRINITY_DN33058_c0_g1_i1:138-1565(-)
MDTPRTLADVSDFFGLHAATAVLVTDAKFDDCLALWIFYQLNLHRPPGHKVDVTVIVIGIQEVSGGVRLCKHLWECARQCASNAGATSADAVTVRVLGSRTGSKRAARHEEHLYLPFRSGQMWAEVQNSAVEYMQDEPPVAADFVGVMAQFFNFEVVHKEHPRGMNVSILDHIVPKLGGVLTFQMGFNTNIDFMGDAARQQELRQLVWKELSAKVHDAGAQMLFISNGFSFEDGPEKPGKASPDCAFLKQLQSQSPELWQHILWAGLQETSLFATAQMAKWLSLMPMSDIDYEATGLKGALEQFREKVVKDVKLQEDFGDAVILEEKEKLLRSSLDDQAACSLALREAFCTEELTRVCAELHGIVLRACGEVAADYLNRAHNVLKNFGQTLEITDGQHLTALWQNEVAVLRPVKLCLNDRSVMWPVFVESNEGDAPRMWAAKDVNVPLCMRWLERAVTPVGAQELVAPRVGPPRA